MGCGKVKDRPNGSLVVGFGSIRELSFSHCDFNPNPTSTLRSINHEFLGHYFYSAIESPRKNLLILLPLIMFVILSLVDTVNYFYLFPVLQNMRNKNHVPM